MPTLNTYQNDSGYYIRAQVNDSIVTYQTTLRADKLFDELGFTPGSSIPWTIIRDLKERGDVYTGSSGVDFNTVGDEFPELSEEQERIYRHYLDEEESSGQHDQITTALDALLGEADSLSETPTQAELRESIVEDIMANDDENLVTSLQAFSDVPYRVTDISIEESQVTFEFAVTDTISILCRDKRWLDTPYDFEGAVNYDQPAGTDAAFSLRDGCFARWSMPEETVSESESLEERHLAAFRADFGPKSGLGFGETNWTEIVRQCFLHIDRYDVRPDRQGGHRGLCSPDELSGKHIWVKAHRTQKSSSYGGPGKFVITNEMINIHLPDVAGVGWYLIEVENVEGRQTKGQRIH